MSSSTTTQAAMAATTSLDNPTTFASSLPRGHHHQASVSVSTFSFSNSIKQRSFKSLISQPILASTSPVTRHTSIVSTATSDSSSSGSATSFHGLCYVVGDNIDTDKIIPSEYLTLVPSKPDEYKKLGSYALIELPASYETRFLLMRTRSGGSGGRWSSGGGGGIIREDIFRNSVATGEVYPLESEGMICEECKTGDTVTIELAQSLLINHTTGKEYKLKPIGDVGPVIEASGIFAFARKAGMIPA
ncbi:hypothetical protein Lser_V15G31484 [Lactuca serriola]